MDDILPRSRRTWSRHLKVFALDEPAEDHLPDVRAARASVDGLVVAGHAFEHDRGELLEHGELKVLVGVRSGGLTDLVWLGGVLAHLSEEQQALGLRDARKRGH